MKQYIVTQNTHNIPVHCSHVQYNNGKLSDTTYLKNTKKDMKLIKCSIKKNIRPHSFILNYDEF